jgi:tripartite-type tricarboxylate transporter receptor subunit TctC
MKLFLFRSTVISVVAMLHGAAALAQTTVVYPNKPIRLVVPQPPGGASDIQMRLYAHKVSEYIGQQIIIDNRAAGGVASLVTYATVARANPDGYTLMAILPSFTFIPALVKEMPVDPIRDFAPVTQLIRAPYLLVAHPGTAAKSVKELIALAKAQPGTLNFGAGNIGSGTHLVTMWFLNDAGIRSMSTYVPYRGTGPALIDLMAGRIHASITSIISSGPLVKSGKLRPLGITSAQRSRVLPDIPTIAEQGVAGYDAYTFAGWVAPAKTPPSVLNRLSTAAAQAAKSAELGEKLKDDGGEPVGSTPEEFRQLITREIPRWRKLVKDLGITATPE